MQPKTFLLAALITLSIGASIYEGLFYWHGLQVKGGAALLWPFVFLVLIVVWVGADSKDYPQIYRPFEYGYLVFLFWLPYLPYYLWRTRGATGVFILGGFIGLFMLSTMVQWLIYASALGAKTVEDQCPASKTEVERKMHVGLPIRYLVLCLVVLVNGCSGGSSQTPSQAAPTAQSGKVFALMDVGDSTTILNDFAARATVDGLAFRTAWRVLEPQDGVYDWTVLDAAFDSVRARGKQLTLHVGASSLGIPGWLLVTTYTYTAPTGALVTEPIP